MTMPDGLSVCLFLKADSLLLSAVRARRRITAAHSNAFEALEHVFDVIERQTGHQPQEPLPLTYAGLCSWPPSADEPEKDKS